MRSTAPVNLEAQLALPSRTKGGPNAQRTNLQAGSLESEQENLFLVWENPGISQVGIFLLVILDSSISICASS